MVALLTEEVQLKVRSIDERGQREVVERMKKRSLSVEAEAHIYLFPFGRDNSTSSPLRPEVDTSVLCQRTVLF